MRRSNCEARGCVSSGRTYSHGQVTETHSYTRHTDSRHTTQHTTQNTTTTHDTTAQHRVGKHLMDGDDDGAAGLGLVLQRGHHQERVVRVEAARRLRRIVRGWINHAFHTHTNIENKSRGLVRARKPHIWNTYSNALTQRKCTPTQTVYLHRHSVYLTHMTRTSSTKRTAG